ncbi:thermostable hemolysin [Pseudoalteromonas sp. GB56]
METMSVNVAAIQPQYLNEELSDISQGYYVANKQAQHTQPNFIGLHVYSRLAERIQAGFAKHYEAKVHEFMPLLACLAYSPQRYCCFGLRSASNTLFLSQYLCQPLHEYLQQWQCAAHECVELGNLVSTHSQATLAHFVVLAKALQQAGKKRLVFCATAHIRNLLTRVGAQFDELEDALPERLDDYGKNWGSYYANAPKVCVVDVAQVANHVDAVDTLSFFAKSYTVDIDNLAAEVAQL